MRPVRHRRPFAPFPWLVLLALVALPAAAFAQTPDAPTNDDAPDAPACGDPTVVDFVLPGHFADALAAAKERNRCLLIKGVAFGVDEQGATCATKGHW